MIKKILIATLSLSTLVIIVAFSLLYYAPILIRTSCSAYNVRLIGVSFPRYDIHTVNLLGNNFTIFRAGPDDVPSLLFSTEQNGKEAQRHQLDYVSAGLPDYYYVSCNRQS